jgi:hypothetical protein
MSFINLSAVYTADPGDIWTPKNAFMTTDPFALVMNIQVDNSVVDDGLLFDAAAQIVNPAQDPTTDSWWTVLSGNIVSMPTADVSWDGVNFQWGTNFAIWWTWAQYAGAVAGVYGPTISGVYYVQGTVSVESSNLFANSGQFWFKTR